MDDVRYSFRPLCRYAMMLRMTTDPDQSEHLPDATSSSHPEGMGSEDFLRRLSEDLFELESEQPTRRRKVIVGSIVFVFVIVLAVAGIVFYLLR